MFRAFETWGSLFFDPIFRVAFLVGASRQGSQVYIRNSFIRLRENAALKGLDKNPIEKSTGKIPTGIQLKSGGRK
jgi:hypothetical protein